MNRRIVIACVGWLVACGGDDSGGATADDGGSGTSGTSGTASSATTPETTAMSQTASADTTATTTTESTTATTGTDATTTSDTMVDDTTSASSEGDASSSDTGAPATHHLINSDQTECEEPLWCFYNGNVEIPAGDPIEGQECFVAPIEPPFELIEMHYVVASTHVELEGFQLRFYAREGGVPTRLIESIELTSLKASPVEHYYEIEPAIVIDTQEFCVGFGAFEPGLESSIGMAIDTASAIPDVSYVRMEGSGECDIPEWEDAASHVPAPAGNWCMDATIREIR